jgi:hypothetical protein
MPVLPAHLGPALLAGGLAGRKLNFIVLITSTILIDLEVVFLDLRSGYFIYHGFFHTLGGATIFGLLYGIIFFSISQIYWRGKKRYYHDVEMFHKLSKWREHNWTYSLRCIITSSLVGVYLHIAMDWLMYEDIQVLVLLNTNYYYNFTSQYYSEAFLVIYMFCMVSFFIGIGVFFLRNIENRNRWYFIENLWDSSIKDADLWTALGLISTPFALSGMLMIFIFIFAIKANGMIFLFSVFIIILMILGYTKSLDIKNWRLFE